MDIGMPVMDGIAATLHIKADGQAKVLMLTTYDLDEYVCDALAAGASGFLLKDVVAQNLFEAVRVVASGRALLAPTVTTRLVVSDETVKTHVSRILTKLGLRDRVQVVATAYEEGIVVPRRPT